MSANGYVTVVIEEASEEEGSDDVEFEHIGSNMERLQKQMQEISNEIMAHPERAEQLREKILKISQEMQKETQRLQEKVRKWQRHFLRPFAKGNNDYGNKEYYLRDEVLR